MTITEVDIIRIECPIVGCNGVILTTIEELKTKGAVECSNGHEILIGTNQ